MRLYLSSFRIGDKSDELLKMLGSGRRTAFIGNAMDMAEEGAHAASNAADIARLERSDSIRKKLTCGSISGSPKNCERG